MHAFTWNYSFLSNTFPSVSAHRSMFVCWAQALYKTYNPDGDAYKLPYCIITFGFFQFLMSQLPDLHSLRFLNCVSNICTLTFSAIAVGMSIHAGQPSPNVCSPSMTCYPCAALQKHIHVCVSHAVGLHAALLLHDRRQLHIPPCQIQT